VTKAAVDAIRENPSWARMPEPWFRTALWAFGYTNEPVPSRQDIARALIAAQAHSSLRLPKPGAED
jgi:hypothetical protein